VPRRNRPKGARKPKDEDEPLASPNLPVRAPAGWQVRRVQPDRATKQYTCPGCNHEIRIGWAHVVAWRDDDPDARRHWHTPCWERDVKHRR
jgi:hypothetical protein